MSQPSDPSQIPSSSQPEEVSAQTGNWSAKSFESTFRLIDSLIPRASCIYHQILPLSLVEQCLTLGMVNPKDSAALVYVRSLLPSGHYSLNVKPIDSKTLQLILSAYSNATQAAQLKQPSANHNARPSEIPHHLSSEFSEQPTFLIDSPSERSPESAENPPNTSSQERSVLQQSGAPKPSTNFNEQPTLIVDNPEDLSPDLADAAALPQNFIRSKSSTPTTTPQKTSDFQPALEVHSHSNAESVEHLANLSPQKLWQELLSRVISEGIGRLYFERHADSGRIFWSKNGVLQLSLEKVTPAVFQGTIDEFKRLVQLPPSLVQQAKKGEMEKYYRQERLLIRWQIILGKYGEEGTMQVLRGKASELYQQRQVDELATQALRLAESLERKLKQIQMLSCSQRTKLDMLPTLRQIYAKINRYLEELEKS
jgi:hypothetical protein